MSTRVSVSDLHSALVAAETRLERARRALASKGGALEECIAAQEAVRVAERALASAQNEPHAVPIEFPVQWDVGAPLPYLLQNDYRTFLVFFLRDVDPQWDGTSTFAALMTLVRATLLLNSSAACAQRWGRRTTKFFVAIR
jgi:hypothetical protein